MSTACFALEVKNGPEPDKSRQNQWKGNKGDESFVSIQKGRRWDVGKVLHKNSKGCQENMGKNEVTLLSVVIVESTWRAKKHEMVAVHASIRDEK